ncbi:hypothetical protein OSH11_24285 [Kaistia dalseonensis]|uniref:Uncharacterized protein n=1 Tax=Kaistia dalseonensis TaxID=410840 RepID=A0ABU0HDS6_9HYPH|nr:hypothetical protein [Kaistia dalseonensis]MCX5497840.1 hypothetical protein [Kaistia dalseonensis]MDQ0440484.1 hypothetical protein [Kaistia dalseonensis]
MPYGLAARLITVLMFVLLAMATGARADDAAPATAPGDAPAPRTGRFTMVPAEGGFVRLDTETGVVSHCRREGEGAAGVWRCAAIPEETLNKPDALTELTEAVETLGQTVAALRMRVDALEQRPQAQAPSPTDDDVDRALNLSQELMQRFFGMVREMKRAESDDRT